MDVNSLHFPKTAIFRIKESGKIGSATTTEKRNIRAELGYSDLIFRANFAKFLGRLQYLYNPLDHLSHLFGRK